MTYRRSLYAAAVAATVLVAAACVPIAPNPAPTATQVSPSTGGGYITPEISGDGSTVIYRREADLNYPSTQTPRDLIVTRLDTQATTVLPQIRDVDALSANGRYIVHGYAPTWRVDTVTGAQVQLRSGGPSQSLGEVAISADGATVAWLETHYTAGNCPCELRVHVWRNGSVIRNQMIDSGQLGSIFDQYRDQIDIDGAGATVFLHKPLVRQIVKMSVATGAVTAVPLQFPVIDDFAPFANLEQFLAWSEWLLWSSADGTKFLIESDGVNWLVSSGAPQLVSAMPHSYDRVSMSPNGRWLAQLLTTEVRPNVVHQKYTVTDLTNGVTRLVVESDAGTPTGAEPVRTFTGDPSVSDDGEAVYGRWLAPLTGPWPTSVVYVDR